MTSPTASSEFDFVTENGPRRPLPALRTCLLHALWWLVVFFGVARALSSVLPLPADAWTTPKLQLFEQHKDEYDIVFLGSSQIYRHVDPAVLDPLLAAAGYPLRSFNFGVSGMDALETRYVLEQVIAMKPARLRWLVTDFQRMGILLTGDNHRTPRVTSWHDLGSTLLALRLVLESDMGPAWEWDLGLRHLLAFCYRLGNLGVLRQDLIPLVQGTAESRASTERSWFMGGPGGYGEAENGFVSLDEAYTTASGYERKLLRERNDKWKAVATALTERVRSDPRRPRPILSYSGEPRAVQELSPLEREVILDVTRLCRDAGYDLVFINAPDVRQREYLLDEAQRAGLLTVLLDLDDPLRYPELFDPALRFDDLHLRAKGAELYTRLLATLFIEHLAQQAQAEATRPAGAPAPGVEPGGR